MMTHPAPYRSAVAVAVLAALLLAWMSLGVGIIGADGDPANRMYFGVIGVGLVGALVARLQPGGMSLVLVAMAVGQVVVTTIALVRGLGLPYSPPAELLGLNAIFVGLFLTSAWLFQRSASHRRVAATR